MLSESTSIRSFKGRYIFKNTVIKKSLKSSNYYIHAVSTHYYPAITGRKIEITSIK